MRTPQSESPDGYYNFALGELEFLNRLEATGDKRSYLALPAGREALYGAVFGDRIKPTRRHVLDDTPIIDIHKDRPDTGSDA